MGMYNTLKLTELKCPYCMSMADPEIEFKIGELTLAEYVLGDKLVWFNRVQYYPDSQETRPEKGTFEDYGYTDCRHCNNDLWVKIKIVNDILVSAEIDLSHDPYKEIRGKHEEKSDIHTERTTMNFLQNSFIRKVIGVLLGTLIGSVILTIMFMVTESELGAIGLFPSFY